MNIFVKQPSIIVNTCLNIILLSLCFMLSRGIFGVFLFMLQVFGVQDNDGLIYKQWL